MNQAENLISFYQTGFKICAALAVLFLILTVVLFFRFHIRNTIASRTGRARRRTIEQMREANERTGRLKYAGKVALGEYTPMSLQEEKTAQTQKNEKQSGKLPMDETAPLAVSQEETNRKGALISGRKEKKSRAGKFVITKEVLLIHTDEWI